MNIASLPTDSLYKFLAFAGLTALGFVFYMFLKQRNYLLERLDSHKLEVALLEVEVKWLKRDASVPDVSAEERAALLSRARGAEVAFAKLQQNVLVSNRLGHELTRLGRVAVVAGLLALIAASAGFYLWYVRYQRYQDRAVAAAAFAPARP